MLPGSHPTAADGKTRRGSAKPATTAVKGTPIEQRTLSVADLIAFTNEHSCWDMPTYRVVGEVIKRVTAATKENPYMRFHDLMVARAN